MIENAFSELGQGDWQVWLGPAIGKTAFEVGREVKEVYQAKSPKLELYFQPKNNGKFLADINGLAIEILNDLGVTDIYQEGICTHNNPNFYSYRRDGQTGRMAAAIVIQR
ncbi:laccase domain-containing protein [Piscirickettsia litoralis]|uniref:laccase domain-containing protein n=1 Tax=Piscirickettsia litoralis TaxID=1891921 RepID=UPI000ADFFD4E|nr:laccase domain-containing protein [Piscirickettsia litoralis]